MQTHPIHPLPVRTPKISFVVLLSVLTVLITAPNLHAQSGTWINLVGGDASGNWSTAANWNGGGIADGADNTADFSTLDITTNSTVTLDTARTIGNLLFGDVTPDADWLLTAGTLTLSVSVDSPTVTVNNQTATIESMVSGFNGLTKSGDGTLVLNNAANDFSGDITVTAGILRAEGPANATNPYLGASTDPATTNNIITVNDGATISLGANTRVNNKQVFISGNGVGGTQGAFYVDATGTGNGTRWGIGASGLDPVLTLEADSTIRVDGDASGANTANFLVRSLGFNGMTLTKTGTGRLQFDQAGGVSGDGLVIVAEGVLSFRGGGFTGNRSLTIDAGAEARIGGDNNALNSTVNTVNINGLLDLNARNPGDNSFSQTIGLLFGNGTITSGTFGNTGTETLTISHDETTNSVFSGTITQNNGVVNIVKDGANTLTLSGNNSYAGNTIVNGGTLLVTGTYTGGGNYTVNAGGTLAGTTTISAVVTNNGGIITAGDPSNPGGTLTVNSDIVSPSPGSVVVSNATLAVSGSIGASAQPLGVLDMSGATLQIPLPTLGPAVFVYTLNVDSSSTISFTMATPLKGQFPILSYSSISGAAGFAGLSLVAPEGVTATLSNNVAKSTIDVVITGIPAQIWAGTVNGDWDIGITANWQGGETYTEPGGVGLYAIFDDTAPGTNTVNLTTALTPKGVIVNNSALNYTFTGSGKLTGAGGILKEGSGTLTVANSGNDFTGGVSLEDGTVQVGDGGTTGDLGSGLIANLGTLALNRSDDFALANTVSGDGAITKAGAGAATVPVSGDSSGTLTVNAGTLLLGPVGVTTISGSVTGGGAFGVNGAGKVVLTGLNNTYSGGTVIQNGTLQFGDDLGGGMYPPAGSITDNGTLATTISGTLANDISGTGGLSIISNAAVTLSGNNTFTGPTAIRGPSGATLTATAASYPAGSALMLGTQDGTGEGGTANFTDGNPLLGGLFAGNNSQSVSDLVNLGAGNQVLMINGNVSIGSVAPAGAQVLFQVVGTAASVVVQTNGGVIQLGLGAAGSGVNPDNILADFSLIDNLIVDLGDTGVINLGTLDGNPGPPSGATVVNQLNLASVSNSITAGTLTIGAGGRQLTPDLRLGAGTNILNVGTLNVGTGGRDGGSLEYNYGAGSVRIRGATGGSSRADYNQGVNTSTGTGAGFLTAVDFTGGPADLLFGPMVIGNEPNRGGSWTNTFTFAEGVLDATSVSLSQGCRSGTSGDTTMNINGGTVSLGAVSLTASSASGALNVNGGTISVNGITATGTGASALNIANATLNLNLPGFGNPTTAPITAGTFSPSGTVNLAVDGMGFTVGQFPLIAYSGIIGGSGFSALNLAGLPTDVSGYLSNNTANASVDLVITAAPPPGPNPFPTNIVVGISGNTLNLSWPADHLGWTLLTNSVGLAASDAWYPYPGSAGLTNVSITVIPTQTNVLFRLVYPYP